MSGFPAKRVCVPVVANVPIGLALFASLTSQVGDGLTRPTEQASRCQTT